MNILINDEAILNHLYTLKLNHGMCTTPDLDTCINCPLYTGKACRVINVYKNIDVYIKRYESKILINGI